MDKKHWKVIFLVSGYLVYESGHHQWGVLEEVLDWQSDLSSDTGSDTDSLCSLGQDSGLQFPSLYRGVKQLNLLIEKKHNPEVENYVLFVDILRT